MSDMNQDMARRLRIGPGQPLADGGYALRVVQVPGRRSGRPVVTPVGVLRWGGQDYLVCPDRTRDWPRNLTAHPECLLWTGSTATTGVIS